MTDEELNTLIPLLESVAASEVNRHWLVEGDIEAITQAAKALTDLRTERDAAHAVIDKARSTLDRSDTLSGAVIMERFDRARVTLTNHPTSALADRDARILEEAAREVYDGWKGGTGDEGLARQWAEGWLRARAVSRRREASPQEDEAE